MLRAGMKNNSKRWMSSSPIVYYYNYYLSLGSNIQGIRTRVLNSCLRNLNKYLGEHGEVMESSHLYETKGVNMVESDQDDSFLNACCKVRSELTPIELLDSLKQLEADYGRDIHKPFTGKSLSRSLDVDILFFEKQSSLVNDISKKTGRELIVPHPRLFERDFVIKPLADILPLREKILSKPFQEIAEQVPATSHPYRVLAITLDDSRELVLPLLNNNCYSNHNNKKLVGKMIMMGILNITPDSFSDGGNHLHTKNALAHARQMVLDGAQILDIGGESTRPGAESVSLEEELSRILPILEEIKRDLFFKNVAISVDTSKAEVARIVLEKKLAHIINDISGGNRDPNMLPLLEKYQVPCILMHSRGTSKTMNSLTNYGEVFMDTLLDEMNQTSDQAIRIHQLFRHNVILDPGIGFAKTAQHNLACLQSLNKLVTNNRYNLPILLGTSRKRFLSHCDPSLVHAKDRDPATCATTVVAVQSGVSIVRVHNVKDNQSAARVAENIFYFSRNGKE